MRRLARLSLIFLVACGTKETDFLRGTTVAPEPEVGETARAVLLYDEMGQGIGHLVVSEARSGVVLLRGAIHTVDVEQDDDRLVVTGFDNTYSPDVPNTEILRMSIQWIGEAFGPGEGTVRGSSTLCDVDYCNDPEPFSYPIRVGPVPDVAELEVTLRDDEAPSRYFPSDTLTIHFDRFLAYDDVRAGLRVVADGVEIPGAVTIARSTGEYVAAVDFAPSEAFPFSASLDITLPGAVPAQVRIVDDPGPLRVRGELDMTHWVVPDAQGLEDSFNCLASTGGPLLVLRADFGRADRAYAYFDVIENEPFELDVLSASSWLADPRMASVRVNGRIVYEHGAQRVPDEAQCREGAEPYEIMSGGAPVRIDVGGQVGARMHITVETWSEGLSPSSAVVVGRFAGR